MLQRYINLCVLYTDRSYSYSYSYVSLLCGSPHTTDSLGHLGTIHSHGKIVGLSRDPGKLLFYCYGRGESMVYLRLFCRSPRFNQVPQPIHMVQTKTLQKFWLIYFSGRHRYYIVLLGVISMESHGVGGRSMVRPT